MGNLEDDGRPDWLPEKFNSPEMLAKSYRELEQAYTRLSTEKRELEEDLNSSDDGYTEEDLEALSAAVPYAQAVTENINSSEPVRAAQRIDHAASNLDVMRMLTEAARQAEAQVDLRVGQSLGSIPQTPDLNQTALAGLEQMRATHPGWDENSERLVSVEIEQNPVVAEMVSRAVESQAPENVTMALSGAYAAAQARQTGLAEATRSQLETMKVQAQTMTGSMGRPSQAADNAEWQAIKAATPNRYVG